MNRPLSALADEVTTSPGRGGDDVRAALAMLTRIPVGTAIVRGTGVRAYATVGAALGLGALLPLVALGATMPTVAAILAVALLALLSGGLHLDGLADTFDALAAVGPAAAQRARRDPAIGAAGGTALVLVIALDVALLAGPLLGLGSILAGCACVLAGAVSRATPAALAWFARSRVGCEGLATWLVRGVNRADAAIALGGPVVLGFAVAFLVGSPALAIGGFAGVLVSTCIGLALVRLRGQLDGDVLGASVELGFAATLLTTATVASLAPSLV